MPPLDDFIAAYRAGEVVFFAGAGASFDSKAAMPPAVLATSAELFLPRGSAYAALVDDVVRGPSVGGSAMAGIQPEVFYEHLLSLCEDRAALSLWKVLSPTWLAAQGVALRPNANHLAIARYAAQSGAPVFTTNFDTLFETAAQDQGIPVEICLTGQHPEPHRPPTTLEPGRLRLFKLHGSIEVDGVPRLDSLQTTMQGISAVNQPMIDIIRQACRGRALALVGYSGCDIDYFPVLGGLAFDRPPFWFTPGGDQITRDHAARIGARQIDEYPSALFSRLHPEFPEKRRGPSVKTLLTRLKAEATVHLTEGQKVLFLALCLQSTGRNEAARRCLADLTSRAATLTARDQAISLLLQARVQDCTSEYRQSAASAKAALPTIRRAHEAGEIHAAEAAALRARSLYHQGMAAQQQIGPSIRYHDARFDWRPRSADMLHQLAAGAILWFRLHLLRLRFAKAAARDPRVGFVRAEHAINDHSMLMLGRVIALLEILRIQKAPLVGPTVRGLVARLQKRASRMGDYFVYAGTLKYERRLGGVKDTDHAVETYHLLRDPLNYALVRRDAGAHQLDEGELTLAAIEFRAAAEAALACGSRATAVKALVGLASCGALSSTDAEELAQAATDIEGAGYEDFWSVRLRPWLDDGCALSAQESS